MLITHAQPEDHRGLGISFNAYGDPTSPVLQIQQENNNAWVVLKQFGLQTS